MSKITLNRTEAKKITLYFQGLTGNRFGVGKEASEAVLVHLGYVQIDTISIVARAHHHVFWSRNSSYEPEHLSSLVATGQAFEYWSHAAAYLPMRDFRFSLPRKKLYATGKRHWFTETSEHRAWGRKILARIRAEGALPVRAFEAPAGHRSGGWFEAKPAKQMLQQLFMEGRLMISGRQGFQKLYDLTERVVPSQVNTSFPSPREHARHLIDSALRTHGFARPDEIAYLRSAELRTLVKNECRQMEKEGELTRLAVDGIDSPYLASTRDFPALAAEALAQAPGAPRILSPFDNQVIQRRRLKEIFGFDYLIECYVPAPKRKFGYFCLPILSGHEFIGRIDAKAHREEKRLEVKALHWEKRAPSARVLAAGLGSFARFNGCERVSR